MPPIVYCNYMFSNLTLFGAIVPPQQQPAVMELLTQQKDTNVLVPHFNLYI